MRILPCLLGYGLLVASFGASANTFNGQARGVVDGHPVDVALACDRQTLGKGYLLTAQSDPTMDDDRKDLDGDGVMVFASSNGRQAVFEILAADQQYRFIGKKNVAFSDNGVAIKSTLTRYEGKGPERKAVGQYTMDLKVDCRPG